MSDHYTIEDAYALAQTSSDLSMSFHRQKPVDVLLAVAISKSRLGSALLRLHTEWDSCRSLFGRVPNVEISQAFKTFGHVEKSLQAYCLRNQVQGDSHQIVRLAMYRFLLGHSSDEPEVERVVAYMNECTRECRRQAKRYLYGRGY